MMLPVTFDVEREAITLLIDVGLFINTNSDSLYFSITKTLTFDSGCYMMLFYSEPVWRDVVGCLLLYDVVDRHCLFCVEGPVHLNHYPPLPISNVQGHPAPWILPSDSPFNYVVVLPLYLSDRDTINFDLISIIAFHNSSYRCMTHIAFIDFTLFHYMMLI